MSRALLIALGVVGVLTLLAGAGYGGWYAWDRGVIPGNPRAPTPEAMLASAKRSAYFRARMQGRACLGPDAGRVQPDQQGVPGIANRVMPGQHAVSYLVEGVPHTQDARERILQQYGFLAKQGFYTESDRTLETDAGPKAAKEFRLTWKGFAAQNQDYSPCFAMGRREFARIEKIERVPADALGMELWEVAYQNVASGVPEWAQGAEVKSLFPRYAEATAPRTDKVRLMRGKEGWITEQEMQMQLQMAQMRSANQDPAMLAAQMKRAYAVPETVPDGPTIKRLFDEFLASEQWQARSSAACLPMPLQRGGDERGTPASTYDRSFDAVWLDAPPGVRRDHERNSMLTQLHVLSALEAAGLATLEKAKAGTVNNQPVSTGVRFTVKPEALDSLGLGGGGCMPVGRIGKIELAGYSDTGHGAGVRLAARGELTGVQPWAQSLSQWLPALKALLEEGVPFVGQLQFSPVYDRSTGAQGESKWHVVGLNPSYPQVQFTSVPVSLQPYLPVTTQSTAKLVRAPALLPGVPMTIQPPGGAAIQVVPAPMIAPRARGAPAPALQR